LSPVPGAHAPDLINNLTSVKDMRKWLKALHSGRLNVALEIGGDHHFWTLFMSLHTSILAGGGWVKNSDGDLLIIERNGKIDMPKGKLEPKETIEICAVREVEEECRVKHCEITGPPVKTFHCYPFKGDYALKITYWYPMFTRYSKKLKPQQEEGITDVYWASPKLLSEKIRIKPVYNSLDEVLRKFSGLL